MSNEAHDVEQRFLPISSLVANEWNPQEQDNTTFNRLVEEISSTGFIDPLQVVPLEDGTYRIIGGQHRWEAAKVVGLHEVPCTILTDSKWQDEDLQKFVTVRLNVLKGQLNPEKFAKLYNEMASKYGADSMQGLMGYSDKDGFEKMVGSVKKGLKKALPKELQNEFDKKSKGAKTPDQLAAIIQTLFAKYGETMDVSFMVFTHGKADHIYVAMDKAMKKAMDRVLAYCTASKTDINAFMAPIVQQAVDAVDTAPPIAPEAETVEGAEQGSSEASYEEFEPSAEAAPAAVPQPVATPSNGAGKRKKSKPSSDAQGF